MKNDCIILKKKEYEDLVAKANGNKPDYINIYIRVVANETIEHRVALDSFTSSLILGGSLKSQIFSIRDQLEERIQKNLEFWEDRLMRKESSKMQNFRKNMHHKIMIDLENLLHKWPLRNALKEWQKIVQDDKYFEL